MLTYFVLDVTYFNAFASHAPAESTGRRHAPARMHAVLQTHFDVFKCIVMHFKYIVMHFKSICSVFADGTDRMHSTVL